MNPLPPAGLTAVPCPLEELDCNEELLQSAFWARFKMRFGWRALAFRLNYRAAYPAGPGPEARPAAAVSVPVLCLQRSLPAGYSLIYIPFGPALPEPELPAHKEELLARFTEAVRAHLPGKAIFVRCDPPWCRTGEHNQPPPLRPGDYSQGRIRKAAMDIQPLSTVLLDIRPDEEALLAGMKPKTRYNIKLAFRKGVVVEEAGAELLPLWHQLSQETKERDKIAIHTLAYYQALFQLAGASMGASMGAFAGASPSLSSGEPPSGEPPFLQCKLLLARVDEEAVAGIIVLFRGKRAYYLYGASSNRQRNLMPNHALQWSAIRLARAAGCESYDFCGIPPVRDPGEAMYGLYQFKTGFGGAIINRYGCYDVILKPWHYAGYSSLEQLRTFYHRVLKKRLRG